MEDTVERKPICPPAPDSKQDSSTTPPLEGGGRTELERAIATRLIDITDEGLRLVDWSNVLGIVPDVRRNEMARLAVGIKEKQAAEDELGRRHDLVCSTDRLKRDYEYAFWETSNYSQHKLLKKVNVNLEHGFVWEENWHSIAFARAPYTEDLSSKEWLRWTTEPFPCLNPLHFKWRPPSQWEGWQLVWNGFICQFDAPSCIDRVPDRRTGYNFRSNFFWFDKAITDFDWTAWMAVGTASALIIVDPHPKAKPPPKLKNFRKRIQRNPYGQRQARTFFQMYAAGNAITQTMEQKHERTKTVS